MSVNNHRKCAKCGRTRAENMTVTYHRFPNPGKANITKARAWATYCWPNEDWTSTENLHSLHSLHKSNKVLCGRHFTLSQFYDNQKQKLSKFALPDFIKIEEQDRRNEHMLCSDMGYILCYNLQNSLGRRWGGSLVYVYYMNIAFVTQGKRGMLMNVPHTRTKVQISRVPFSSLENIQTVPILDEPSTSVVLSTPEIVVEDKNKSSESIDKTLNAPHIHTKGQISSVPFSSKDNIQTLYNLNNPSTSALLTIPETAVEDKNKSESIDNAQDSSIKIQTTESTIGMGIQSQNVTSQFKTSSAQRKIKCKKSLEILRAINVSSVKNMTKRETKMYNIIKSKLRELNRLRKQLKNRKLNTIKALAENENVHKLSNLNISNTFLVLLQSQLKNCPKKPKGRRYTLEQKIMALVLYKKSPACYRLLRRLFALPCQSNLNNLLNRVPLQPGINKHIFESLKKMAQNQTQEENMCILSFDEMSIRKHLHYYQKTDEILGFQDHHNHGRSNQIATKALVFMLAGLRKKWKQPIAFYFSHTLTADRLTVILKEILTECLKSDINVVSTVCDLSTVNIKTLKTLGASIREPFFMHNEREIVAVLDPPHLLKCTRNMLMKHDVVCTTDLKCHDETAKGAVKWSHFDSFYNLDKNNANFVYAPALTDHHLHPNLKQQMRVKLAAQVLSHSVAAGMLAKIASNELPQEAYATAMFAQKFDELFDAVNADSPDLRRGKKYSTNLTTRSPHIALFGNMRKFISTMKYVGCKSKPPSQEGWIHTMNAMERLWKNLQPMLIKSLSTRRLNQDPLENCFGCIRYNCGSNNNPTIQQFIAGVKTAIVSNLRHSGQKKNCEDDTATLFNNFSTLLTSTNISFKSIHVETNEHTNEMDMLLLDAAETVEQATSESQACAYVSGFIFKKLKHNSCNDCRNAWLSKNPETIHIFTSFKEFSDNNSLNYVNKDVVKCVETMATIINNYLKINGWKELIRQNIMVALEAVDFSFLYKCVIHLETNMYHIKSTTFFICIKRFVILKNREMDKEEKVKATERKMKILRNK